MTDAAGLTAATNGDALLAVSGLTVDYRRQQRRAPPFRAVSDVDFDIWPSETLGLVGQSGSGKSTIGRAILGLVQPTAGAIVFEGADITRADAPTRRSLSARLQVVFQDPYSSLNPSRTIGQTLAEPLRVHLKLSRQELKARIGEALERVRLPASAADRYPGQFSGGQRQRIAIARALMLSPRLVVCDEPVSSLDLSVQAQVLNLLAELQRELAVSYLFIAHDLAVVRYLSHRIIVLECGRIVEAGAADQVYRRPDHPYTRALIAAAPVPDPEVQYGRSVRLVEQARAGAASGSG
jgi:ABC-type glutathione transport system ATPase component